MTVCALIKDGVVVNVIIAEAHDPVPEGYIMVCKPPPRVIIGTKWNGKQFELPPDD
jgi:hypothetical protein